MKKSYEQPLVYAIHMETDDIITSSNGFTYVNEHSGDIVQWKSKN